MSSKFNFRPIVVLVRSLYDSNIGASSRAMANMGCDELILLNPQCAITFSAQQAAATGQKALQTRRTYASWDDFFAHEPDGLRIAFTARDGQGRLVQDFSELLQSPTLRQSVSEFQSAWPAVYLIFGPEDAGLAGEDLELVHHSASLPTYGQNPSLNLAQAVLLALFILRHNWGGQAFDYGQRGEETQFQTREKLFPEKSLRTFLTTMGFSIQSRRTNVYTVFRRLLLRGMPTEKERRLLEIIFQQGARKMRPPSGAKKSETDSR